MEAVQSNTAAVKKEAAETVLMRAELIKIKANSKANSMHGWHNWSEGVPAAGNTRPRPSEDKPAGDLVTGEGGKSE